MVVYKSSKMMGLCDFLQRQTCNKGVCCLVEPPPSRSDPDKPRASCKNKRVARNKKKSMVLQFSVLGQADDLRGQTKLSKSILDTNIFWALSCRPKLLKCPYNCLKHSKIQPRQQAKKVSKDHFKSVASVLT